LRDKLKDKTVHAAQTKNGKGLKNFAAVELIFNFQLPQKQYPVRLKKQLRPVSLPTYYYANLKPDLQACDWEATGVL
jgi:hypothetical protein